MSWTPGNNSGSQTLTIDDDLFESHINELRVAADISVASLAAKLSSASNLADLDDFSIARDNLGAQVKSFVVIGTTDESDYQCTGTNDQVVFQTAINAVGASGGGIVFVRPGIYYFDSFLTTNYSNITLRGSGRGATTIVARYDATSIFTAPGCIGFRGTGNVPCSNIIIRGFSFNLNHNPTGALEWKSSSGISISRNFLLEDVEIFNFAPNASTPNGALLFFGASVADNFRGTLKDLKLNRVEIRDSDPTTSSKRNAHSISILSDDLENFTIEDSYIHDVYGTPVHLRGGNAPRLRKNWVFKNVVFKNTIKQYFGNGISIIDDSTQHGFTGQKFVNCHFEDPPGYWGNGYATDLGISADVHCIRSHQTVGLIVEGNTFLNVRQISNFGNSFPLGQEAHDFKFTNNVMIDCYQFQDPDGIYGGTYDGNVFAGFRHSYIMGDYGRHWPTMWKDNLFYNCGVENDSPADDRYNAICGFEAGGHVVDGNVFYWDRPATKVKFIFAEAIFNAIGSGAQPSDIAYNMENPNIYRNNHVYGRPASVRTFNLDSGIRHIIKDNTGVMEDTIQNTVYAGSASVSALTPADVVANNYTNTGELTNQFYDLGPISGSTTIQCANGTVQRLTLVGNVSLIIPQAAPRGTRLTLECTQDSSGSRTITMPATTKIVGGVWTLTSTANATDTMELMSDGSFWLEIGRNANLTAGTSESGHPLGVGLFAVGFN